MPRATQPRVVRTFAAQTSNWLCAGRCRWLAVAVTLAVTVAVDVVALLRCNPPLPAPVGPLIVAPAPSTAAAKPADRQLPCCLALSPRPLPCCLALSRPSALLPDPFASASMSPCAVHTPSHLCARQSVHMPAQSGSTSVLAAMRRGYTRESYYDLVDHIRSSVPGVTLSSDFIAGYRAASLRPPRQPYLPQATPPPLAHHSPPTPPIPPTDGVAAESVAVFSILLEWALPTPLEVTSQTGNGNCKTAAPTVLFVSPNMTGSAVKRKRTTRTRSRCSSMPSTWAWCAHAC